jgi:hypothetical protein
MISQICIILETFARRTRSVIREIAFLRDIFFLLDDDTNDEKTKEMLQKKGGAHCEETDESKNYLKKHYMGYEMTFHIRRPETRPL